jgi:hypothetical protein
LKGEKAECYREEDKQVLLAVIEASFGNFAVFDKVVRSVTITPLARSTPALSYTC